MHHEHGRLCGRVKGTLFFIFEEGGGTRQRKNDRQKEPRNQKEVGGERKEGTKFQRKQIQNEITERKNHRKNGLNK